MKDLEEQRVFAKVFCKVGKNCISYAPTVHLGPFAQSLEIPVASLISYSSFCLPFFIFACLVPNPNGQISVKFHIGEFLGHMSRKTNVVNFGPKHLAHRTKSKVSCVAGYIKSPLKRCVEWKWHYALRIAEEV
jgi:hypothetical protein